MIGKLDHQDLLAVEARHANAGRRIPRQRIVEADAALLILVCEQGRGERLGDRADLELGGGIRAPAVAGVAVEPLGARASACTTPTARPMQDGACITTSSMRRPRSSGVAENAGAAPAAQNARASVTQMMRRRGGAMVQPVRIRSGHQTRRDERQENPLPVFRPHSGRAGWGTARFARGYHPTSLRVSAAVTPPATRTLPRDTKPTRCQVSRASS